MSRGPSLAAFLAPLLLAATAAGDPPAPPPTPAPAPPVTGLPVVALPPGAASATPPPVAKPKPAATAKKPPAPKEPELPDPEVHLRVLARSAEGLWMMRIENDGPSPVRVPADARLLELTIESGDTMSKKAPKPVKCKLPAGMRPAGFPDPRSLLLAPGEAYVELFDPRLFCFGKDSKALEGGAIVRARLGWDAPKNAKKLEPPFAVESTEIPNAVTPQKSLTAPSFVLSWEPPDLDDGPAVADKDKDDDDDKPKEEADGKDKDGKDKDGKDKEPAIVDEHAPKIEIAANPFAEAATGFRVAITVKATNTGHRPTLAAIRSRMVSFRIEGPDGTIRCGAVNGQTRAIARDGYRLMKPKDSTSLTILVEEACGRSVFRRPGLYRVTPSLRLTESGAEHGIAAYTGFARAKEPTLVRVSQGHDPYHSAPPKAVRPAKTEADIATP